jgi:hypothetical protein
LDAVCPEQSRGAQDRRVHSEEGTTHGHSTRLGHPETVRMPHPAIAVWLSAGRRTNRLSRQRRGFGGRASCGCVHGTTVHRMACGCRLRHQNGTRPPIRGTCHGVVSGTRDEDGRHGLPLTSHSPSGHPENHESAVLCVLGVSAVSAWSEHPRSLTVRGPPGSATARRSPAPKRRAALR